MPAKIVASSAAAAAAAKKPKPKKHVLTAADNAYTDKLLVPKAAESKSKTKSKTTTKPKEKPKVKKPSKAADLLGGGKKKKTPPKLLAKLKLKEAKVLKLKKKMAKVVPPSMQWLASGKTPEDKLQSAIVKWLEINHKKVWNVTCCSLAGIGVAACTKRARDNGYRVVSMHAVFAHQLLAFMCYGRQCVAYEQRTAFRACRWYDLDRYATCCRSRTRVRRCVRGTAVCC
jgi:hypothetical protein